MNVEIEIITGDGDTSSLFVECDRFEKASYSTLLINDKPISIVDDWSFGRVTAYGREIQLGEVL